MPYITLQDSTGWPRAYFLDAFGWVTAVGGGRNGPFALPAAYPPRKPSPWDERLLLVADGLFWPVFVAMSPPFRRR
jgi:hypothetical protein